MSTSPKTRPQVGDLVVVRAEPSFGVGRLERLLAPVTVGEKRPALARVFFYLSGRFAIFPLPDVEKAPPGVWPPQQKQTDTADVTS